MSFESRHQSFLIHSGALTTGTVTLPGGQVAYEGDEEATINEEGWDSLSKPYFMLRASLTAEQCAVMFPAGARLGTRTWWIAGARPVRVAAGFFRVDVTFKGWADVAKPAKIRVGASGEQQSAENVRAPESVGDTVGAIFAKVQTHENMPTVSVAYLVPDITASGVANTDKVGTAQDPPVTIAVPDTVWSFLTTYVYHWPNGWVLMGSEQDRLPGSDAALVIDSYKYVRDKTPG